MVVVFSVCYTDVVYCCNNVVVVFSVCYNDVVYCCNNVVVVAYILLQQYEPTIKIA